MDFLVFNILRENWNQQKKIVTLVMSSQVFSWNNLTMNKGLSGFEGMFSQDPEFLNSQICFMAFGIHLNFVQSAPEYHFHGYFWSLWIL